MSSAGGNGDLEAAAALAVEAALAEGADQADAWCEDSVERTVRVYEGAVESITEAGSKGAGVRAFSRRALRLRLRLRSERGRGCATSRARRRRRRPSPRPTSMPASRRPPARRASPDLRDPGFGDWTMERRIELALAVERAARERDPLITNVEDTVYSDTEARAALATRTASRGSYEETQCYAFAYAFAGDGADRMTGTGLRGCPRAGCTRTRAGRAGGGRPRARAARRAPAREPALSRGAGPVRGGELRGDHRRHAVGRRGAARALAVRGQGGRADRRTRPSG